MLPDESAEQAPGLIAQPEVPAERLGYRAVWPPDHVLPPEP
ncbi:hypothetical protein [Allonocardiopsis opalescens]|uniref:Uncharacterized protein n=1 Tax=Allonocardiopsis opalescens TaxID=1144618 RepID=A0A2T0Q4S5_9ACTN|nr:hypothetical protein [Allonocardiopsis opalescens]PRX98802.1 hypothetical protein CLV72_104382 [Allonocardiopsis opalescens]